MHIVLLVRKYINNYFLFIPPVFYLLTCAPTIGLGDTALLLDGIRNLKVNSHANNHNITVIFGWLFSFLPFGTIAYKGNLVSVFFGSLTIVAFYFLIFDMFRSRIGAAITATLLMISHSMWWHSTIVECYAPNALFTVAALWFLHRYHEKTECRYLYGLFFISGLAIFNHVQMGILSVGATVALLWQMVRLIRAGNVNGALRLFGFCSLFFFLGFAPYLITVFKDIYYAGDFSRVISDAFGGSFKSIMLKGSLYFGIIDLLFLIFKQFPSFFLLFIPPGIFYFYREWRTSGETLAVASMFLLNTVFFMFYNTWDKFAFLLPSFIILVFLGSYAIFRAVDFISHRKFPGLKMGAAALFLFSILFPPYLYANISGWASTPGFWYFRYNNNYTVNSHDCAEYIANPDKRNYYDVEEFAEVLFKILPAGAIFVDDDSRTYYPIHDYYMKYYGKRKDLNVQIINSWGFDNWGLTPNRFSALLKQSYENNREFFIVSVDHPFRGIITALPEKERYQFEAFSLDEKRWIYRLKLANESKNTIPGNKLSVPYIFTLKTGNGFDGNFPGEKKLFRLNEPIMVSLEFENNSDPFHVQFQWYDPEGKIYFTSKKFVVSSNNKSVWSYMEREGSLESGRWVVKAFYENHLLKETFFIVK